MIGPFLALTFMRVALKVTLSRRITILSSQVAAFIFLMGAFAELGKGQIKEGLRFMLKKPKVEENDGEKTEQTEKPSQ